MMPVYEAVDRRPHDRADVHRQWPVNLAGKTQAGLPRRNTSKPGRNGALFARLPEALENTSEIARRCFGAVGHPATRSLPSFSK